MYPVDSEDGSPLNHSAHLACAIFLLGVCKSSIEHPGQPGVYKSSSCHHGGGEGRGGSPTWPCRQRGWARSVPGVYQVCSVPVDREGEPGLFCTL